MQQEIVLYFNFIQKNVNSNTQVSVEQTCNSFTVLNTGTTVAMINFIPLNPGTPGVNNGESISFGGLKGEILKGRIDISFPATGRGNVIVIQKIYLPDATNDFNTQIVTR